MMAWSTRCRKAWYGAESRTSRPAAARASAASSRRATSVFQEIPRAPPGRSVFAHAGAAARSSSSGLLARTFRSPPTLVNAIEDALAPFGVRIYEQHLPPARILELIGAAAKSRP